MMAVQQRLIATAIAGQHGEMRCSRCNSHVILIHGEPWCPAHGELPFGERAAALDMIGPGDEAA